MCSRRSSMVMPRVGGRGTTRRADDLNLTELGEVLRDRIIEPEAPLFEQHHGRDCRNWLGHRVDPEQRRDRSSAHATRDPARRPLRGTRACRLGRRRPRHRQSFPRPTNWLRRPVASRNRSAESPATAVTERARLAPTVAVNTYSFRMMRGPCSSGRTSVRTRRVEPSRV